MNIDHLLDKYWEAETTLEEEQTLRSYFSSDMVALEHQELIPLFNTFTIEKEVELDNPILIGSSKTPNTSKPSNIRYMGRWKTLGIAASLLIALTVFLYNNDTQKQPSNLVEIETAEESLSYLKDALALVSTQLNNGSQTMIRSMKPLSKANILAD